MTARTFLQFEGESLLVVFTRGMHFEIDPETKQGKTGEWEVDLTRKVDRVLIYHRDDEAGVNKLYIGDRRLTTSADRQGRKDILLEHVQFAGTTPLNWKEFSEGGQNPVRYIS